MYMMVGWPWNSGRFWPAWFIGNVETCYNMLKLIWSCLKPLEPMEFLFTNQRKMGWELGAFFLARMDSIWYSHLASPGDGKSHLMNFPLNRGAPTYESHEGGKLCYLASLSNHILVYLRGVRCWEQACCGVFVFFKPLAEKKLLTQWFVNRRWFVEYDPNLSLNLWFDDMGLSENRVYSQL